MADNSSSSSASVVAKRHHTDAVVWVWTGLLFVATVALLVGGYAYYRHETERIRQEKYQELAAIAKLKAGQIRQWRQGQLEDVHAVATGPLFKKSINEWLRGGVNQAASRELTDRLVTIRHARGYADAVLLDLDGHVLLSARPQPEPVNAVEGKAVQDAVANRSSVLTDLHRTAHGAISMTAVAPLSDPEGRPIAVVLLRSNPESVLYPLVQSWPIPSQTAETLVVRKDGDGILYLNEPRRRPNAALPLREPLTRHNLPAVQAVLGKQGLYQGRDYNGEEVLADLRPIPDSPWFMVAKVDTREILAEARYRGAMTAIFVVLFILLAGGATAYGYRYRQAQLYRDLYQSERNQREVQEHFRTILYSIGDAVITADTVGLVKQMNPVAEALTGWPEGEAVGRPLEEVFFIIDGETRQLCENPVQKVLQTGQIVGLANHTVLIGRDGTERVLTDSGAPIRDSQGQILGVVLVFRDVTEQTRAAEELRSRDETLRAILAASPVGIVLTQDRRIKWANDSWVKMFGFATEDEYLDRPTSIMHPSQEDYMHVRDRLYRDFEPGRVSEAEAKLVRKDGTLFNGHIRMNLLDPSDPAKGDIAAITDISERKKTDEAIRASEDKFRTMVDWTYDWEYWLDPLGRINGISPSCERITGFGPKEFTDDPGLLSRVVHPADRPNYDQHVQDLYQTNPDNEQALEIFRIIARDGTEHWIDHVCRPVYGADGTYLGRRVSNRDITDRKEAERRIQRQGKLLSAINSVLREALESDTDADIARTCLRMAEETTGSRFGFIGEINQAGRIDIIAISDPGWTACRIPESDSILLINNMEIRGIWGAALKGEQSLIINDPASHPDSVGIPDGHPLLTSFMGVPLKRSGETFGVIALANKDGGYDSYDVSDVEALSSAFVEVLDRSRTERALLVSEEKYHNIFDNILEGIFQSTPDGRFIMVNRAFAEMFGYGSPEEMIRERSDSAHQIWVRPEDREPFKRLLADRGFVEAYEFECRTKDGTPIWTSGSVKAIRNESGEIRYYEGTVQDVTGRKQAEQALRRSESLLREAQRVAHIGHWEIDSPAGTPRWSEEIFHIVGLDPAGGEPSFAAIQHLLHPDDWHLMHDSIIRGTSKGIPFDIEFRCIRPDQSIRWMNVKGYPTEKEEGEFFRMFGTAQDITDRKEAEEALLESEERYRQITENSLTGIFLYQDGRSIYANRRMAEMVGYTPEGVLSIPFLEVIHPDDRRMVVEMAAARISGKPVPNHYELRLLHKDGRTVWSEVMSHRIYYQGRPAILGNVVDVTESRLLEDQLRQAQKMEAVGTLAGGVAHDFNNILQVVLGYSDFILEDEELPEHYRADLQRIRESARHGADLVRRLLTFSRKTEINLQPLNLNRHIAELRKILERTISKMINIELVLGEELTTINADPTQIDQILMNLAVNSRDAMPEGGMLVIETANVVLDEEYVKTHLDGKPGNHVLLQITDTGAGMDRETLEHIFEPFYTTKAVGEGTGLGLPMVHGIVQQHGGHVRCYSEPGKGTTFKIYFPALILNEQQKERTVREKPRGGPETILLVDDEKFISDLGSRILTKVGYNVITASNGNEALGAYQARSHEIDLVVLDLIMPEMGGRQCLEALLRINPSIKVVIASGYTTNGPTEEPFPTGVKGFVNKPYEIRQMLEIVRKVLDEDQGVTEGLD